MDFSIDFADLQKLFPISFFADSEGKIIALSNELKSELSPSVASLDFDDTWKLKSNSYFKFDFSFFQSSPQKDFIFESIPQGKEYCFVVVPFPERKTLLFAARNLYRALQESRDLAEHYKSLATFPEENPQPIMRLDFNAKILFANQASKVLFPNNSILLAEDSDFLQNFQKVLQKKEGLSFEFFFDEKCVDIKFVYFESKGYINVYFKDLTQEKLNFKAAQEERSQKIMASKLSSLGEMAAGIGHEINNPLAVIVGQIAILKRTLGLKDFSVAQKSVESSLESIARSSSRIAVIVKSLKNFSRNGEKDPLEAVNTRDLMEEIMTLITEKLRSLDVNFHLEMPEDLICHCRKVQIEQVLINLINNSADAIASSSERWIRLKIFQENNSIVFETHDSGRGLDPSLQDKIMQPFFTTKEVGKGTGLGLSISKGLIESHNGRFFYKAQEANTCFRFELPQNNVLGYLPQPVSENKKVS